MHVTCWSRGLGKPRETSPIRAFYQRVKARRDAHAEARKRAVPIWHVLSKGEDYAWPPDVARAQDAQVQCWSGTASLTAGGCL